MRYPSKLLLFGEYLVITSGEALAIPFGKYSGKWDFAPNQPECQQSLQQLGEYLSLLQANKDLIADLNTEKLVADIDKGLFFDANIPTGYGLGSSGALCAAIYDKYAQKGKILPKDINNYGQLKQVLAQIESFFHGKSSGIDPLVAYTKQAVLVKMNKSITAIDVPQKQSFFLLDTGISRQTAPLVDIFLQKYEAKAFKKVIDEHLIPTSNNAIHNLLYNEEEKLLANFQAISWLQYKHFAEMIPEAFRCIWREGLENGDFYLKLCGAGGGGFLLGLMHKEEKTRVALKGFSIEYL